MLILERSVRRRGAQYHTTYVLHSEKRHIGECADSQKTTAVVIAAGALCVASGVLGNMSWFEGGGASSNRRRNSSLQLTNPPHCDHP